MKNKKEKFTPGPWEVSFVDTTGASTVNAIRKNCAPDRIRICSFPDSFLGWYELSRDPKAPSGPEYDENLININEANAHLIAASPCLFDKLSVALERLKEKSDGSNRDLGLIQSVENTLAKAVGDA